MKSFFLTIMFLIGCGVNLATAETPFRLQEYDRGLPFLVTVKPLTPLVRGEQLTLYMEYSLRSTWREFGSDTGSYSIIFINYQDYSDTLSQTTYPVRYDSTYSYRGNTRVLLPDSDTCWLHVNMVCGKNHDTKRYYFVTTEHGIEFTSKDIRSAIVSKQTSYPNLNSDPIIDTLSEEDLQAQYQVIIDLGNPGNLKTAQALVGPIPDSCKYNYRKGYYSLNITLKNLIKLAEENIEFDYIKPPPWDQRHNSIDWEYQYKAGCPTLPKARWDARFYHHITVES